MGATLINLGSVLVVEDDDELRRQLTTLLASLGYEVASAADGAEAISQIMNLKFDLVITDLGMPKVDGLDLLETIKDAGLDTAVLFISGAGTIGTAVLAIKLGAVNFLEKPVQPDKLKDEVRKIMRDRRMRTNQSTGDLPVMGSLALGSPGVTGLATHPTPVRGISTSPAVPLSGPSHPSGAGGSPIGLVAPGQMQPGVTIGRYIVSRALGIGGMGTVYECKDPVLDRIVAVKVLDHSLARELGERELFIERFRREARAAAQLSHPNIVAVFDFSEDPTRGALYLAMERVEGPTFRKVISKSKGLPLERTLRLIYQTADGLEFAHRHDIVHRDIKPTNLLIAGGDVTKILDFGVARFTNSDLTDSGVVVGSVSYMAPEVIHGEKVDGRADQFALGHVLFEMLTGRTLFHGRNFAEVARKVVGEPVPRLSETGIDAPPALQQILDRLMEKDPNRRYTIEMDLLADLSMLGRELGLSLQPAVPRS